jgi:hypothetical protein
MEIKNLSGRTLEFVVNAKSSETLWKGKVDNEAGVIKDLPEAEAPFTLLGTFGDVKYGYNFMPTGSTGNIPNNKAVATVTKAYPSFQGSVS